VEEAACHLLYAPGSMPSRSKRGTAARQVRLLDELRPVLRAEVSPERMLRSVATVLASSGDYCIADVIDAHGRLRRVEIAHADPSRREKLRVAAQDSGHGHDGRVARLLRSGGAEIASKVTQALASERLADIVLLRDERVRSYMAAAVSVSGAPMAVLTIVTTRPEGSHSRDDLAFLRVVADWTGLGLENALRRELQPRASVAPPPAVEHPILKHGRR
jgi:GAF domain-containing protein